MDSPRDRQTPGLDQTSAGKDVANPNHPPQYDDSLFAEIGKILVGTLAGSDALATAAAKLKYKPDADTENNEVEKLCRGVKVKYSINRQNESGTYVTEKGKAPTTSGQTDKLLLEEGTAMEFIPQINELGLQTKTNIKVFSDRLRHIIRTTIQPILEHENCEKMWTTSPVVISTKNVSIMHGWDKLWDFAHSEGDETSSFDDEHRQAKAELQCFLMHIQRYESQLFQSRDEARKEQSVSFDTMWTLFPPGSEVVSFPLNGLPQIFTVRSHRPSGEFFVVSCLGYDWDGEDLVRYCYNFSIQRFTGKRKVQELPCYPVSFYNADGEDEIALRHKLAKRGRKFREFCVDSMAKSRQFCCSNYTVYDSSATRWRASVGGDAENLNVKLLPGNETQSSSTAEMSSELEKLNIVVDPLLYKRYAGGSCLHLGNMVPDIFKVCVCNLCELDGLSAKWRQQFKSDDPGVSIKSRDSTENDQDSDAMDALYSQLPPRVLGFIVSHKVWAQINVDSIEEENRAEQGEKSWASLSIPDHHKTNIKKLVSNHLKIGDPRDEARIRDLIPDKGEGLIILLHGTPGLGKTMTAEALAGTTKRPLIRIDASDFNYNDSSQVNGVFQKYFHLAHAWGALLLLDEADVFLQLRRREELEQNALVSVLLRQLEYFRGILIMTTNRILTIDIAVQSRVHYSVRFREPDQTTLTKIWETFTKQLDDSNCPERERIEIEKHFEEHWRRDMLKNKFTGRDIRNMFMTAQLLEYPWLKLESLKTVVRSVSDFRDQLQDLARKMEIRQSITDMERRGGYDDN